MKINIELVTCRENSKHTLAQALRVTMQLYPSVFQTLCLLQPWWPNASQHIVTIKSRNWGNFKAGPGGQGHTAEEMGRPR